MWRRMTPIAAIAGMAMTAAAQADTRIVEHTTINCPGLKSMLAEIPENQRGALEKMVSPMVSGAPWITTTYLTRSKMRTDMGATSIIVDAASGRSTTINRQTHTFSLGPYNPFQKATGAMDARITPSGETAVVLGHTVRRYIIRMTSAAMPKSQISGEIWSAPDLPQPLAGGYADGAAGMLEAQMQKVKGMPLAYSLVYRNTPFGDITIYSVASSISESKLPQRIFAVPRSYRPGATGGARGMPSVGYPLGDGMPLDMAAPSGEEAAASGGSGVGDLSQLLGGSSGGSGLAQMLGGSGTAGLSQMLGGGGTAGLSQMLGGGGTAGLSQMLGGNGSESGASISGLLQSLQSTLNAMDSEE